MTLDKILKIAVNIKRIKGLTDNEYIHEAADKIIDTIQEEINLQENKENNESNNSKASCFIKKSETTQKLLYGE